MSDTGIGMSEEFQKVVYESFAREDTDHVRKTEGVGLGMAITKFIIDAMGGTIDLKSAPGKGSQFHIILDLEVGEDPDMPMVLPPWKILVVDDDRSVGENACAFLNEIGAQATWTLDGLTAIEMVREAQEKLAPYEIILIDWKLPFLNGIQTAKRIRELMGDEVTILLISAYDWAEVEEEAVEAGVQGFISKPLFKSTLFHGLTTCLQLPAEPKKTEHKNDFTGHRVLVAEDNELNWEIIDVLLRSYGLELENAKDG